MEEIVKNLTTSIPFKDTTEIGDVVLMVQEGESDGDVAVSYAQVVDFTRDLTKRDEWWQVHFVLLRLPPVPQAIILQPSHFTGQEIFTIGGRKVFIKAIHGPAFVPGSTPPPDDNSKNNQSKRPQLKLVK